MTTSRKDEMETTWVDECSPPPNPTYLFSFSQDATLTGNAEEPIKLLHAQNLISDH